MKCTPLLLLAATMAFAAEPQQPQDPRVQAFVALLKPAERMAVAYPASARQQNLTGMVQVLITFDLAGKVIQAEALAGPAELRQAALDAVKQWTYRPVLRHGAPVFAMTTAVVDVAPPCVPGAPCAAPRANSNTAETVAAFRRIRTLEEQMPRTPEMVLTDSEQQAVDDSGKQRFYDLRGLAKAAADAGALDKAKVYAGELLRMAAQYNQDWNYGNAIHDGNMVLGLVALRQGSPAIARQYLLEAGKTRGSPQLNSFGPNTTLAKELLDANERDIVVQYFGLCRSFWKMGGKRLDEWTAVVRDGGKPDFGPNLAY